MKILILLVTLFATNLLAVHIDSLVYVKHENKLYVYSNGKVIKVMEAYHGDTEGRKQYEGDHKTPEGWYWVEGKNYGSVAYKSMRISYPNKADRLAGRTGGNIVIHGKYNTFDFFPRYNWTWGCIATPNKNMDWLFKHIRGRVRINIRK